MEDREKLPWDDESRSQQFISESEEDERLTRLDREADERENENPKTTNRHTFPKKSLENCENLFSFLATELCG